MSLRQVASDFWLPDRSLRFGAATGDLVNCGTAASCTNLFSTGTSLASFALWVTPTSFPNGDLLSKFRAAGAGWRLSATGAAAGNLEFICIRTVNTSINCTGGPISRLRTPRFVVVTVDLATSPYANFWAGGIDEPMRLFPSTVSNAGALIVADDSARSLFIANRDNATPASAFGGNISFASVYARILGVPEMEFIRKNSPHRGTAFAMFPGEGNIAAPLDVSGNANNGTTVGATLESGVAQFYLLNPNPSFFAVPFGALEWLRHRKNRIRRAA